MHKIIETHMGLNVNWRISLGLVVVFQGNKFICIDVFWARTPSDKFHPGARHFGISRDRVTFASYTPPNR